MWPLYVRLRYWIPNIGSIVIVDFSSMEEMMFTSVKIIVWAVAMCRRGLQSQEYAIPILMPYVSCFNPFKTANLFQHEKIDNMKISNLVESVLALNI